MEKYIIDKRNDLEYELKGAYYYPTGRVQRNGVLTPSEIPEDNDPGEDIPIGGWGPRHYIREHKKQIYRELFLFGQVNHYLAEIERQAEDVFLRLVKEMSEQEGVSEQMKAENQMLWIQQMNSIRERATEIVNRELIYT